VTYLLTGGAGYIGAHVTRALLESGRRVVVLDDLSTGALERLPNDVALEVASIRDTAAVLRVLREHQVTGVVHLAARKAVEESVERPLYYYEENVAGTVSVLRAMESAGVRAILYSSSAAVYGDTQPGQVDEDHSTRPTSPYGETKLAAEWAVKAHAHTTGGAWLALRYFNVAGAGDPCLGDPGAANLIPMVFRAIDADEPVRVFGGDYDTPDGSCVRDYIHVADLAGAHVSGVQALEEGRVRGGVVNIGRGAGASVLEVLDSVRRVTGLAVPHTVVGRRPGDPAQVVARADRAKEQLGWRAAHDLDAMVRSAWEAWSARGATRQR
jgi:UDP-glucose 4-epimerase